MEHWENVLLNSFSILSVGPKYILHEHVGGGSYGDVCRATDLEMNQIVALKVFLSLLF